VTSALGEFPEIKVKASRNILSSEDESCDENITVSVIHPVENERLDQFVRLILKIVIWVSAAGFIILSVFQLVYWFKNPKVVLEDLLILFVLSVPIILVMMSLGPIIDFPPFGNMLVIDPGCPRSIAIAVSLRGLVSQGVSFMGLGLGADLAAVLLASFPRWVKRNESRE
jgi:hypothetical protein